MFRYLSVHWDPTQAPRLAIAQTWMAHLRHRPGWRLVHHTTTTSVWVVGESASGSGTYLLPGDGGVILGRLFKREPRDGVALVPHGRVNLSGWQPSSETAGERLCSRWWGRYVALWHAPGGVTTVMPDPTGGMPCFVWRHEGVTLLFSWLEDALALPGLPLPQIRWPRMADHLRQGDLGATACVLDGIERLEPGQAIDIRQASPQALRCWDAQKWAGTPLEDDTAQLLPLLRKTVRFCGQAWAQGQDRLLLRLSGGLNSAVLASALLGGSDTPEIFCVNYHSPGSDTDERDYAREVAHHLHLPLIERPRDDRFALERVLDVALTPSPVTYVGRMSAADHDAALAARHEVRSLFTGAGGDQLFFELGTWWPAADFLARQGLRRGLTSALLDAARLARLSVWRTAALAARACWGGHDPDNPFSWSSALLGRAVRLDPPPPAPAAPDGPRQTARLPIGKRHHLRMLLQPAAYYDPYLREQAPELVNPLLSQPLMELCLRLPTYRLIEGGQGRALARRAFAPDLPARIVTRLSKGSTEDHLKQVLAWNRAWVRPFLLDGELVARDLLDRQAVEDAFSDRPRGPAVPIADLHIAIAMEAWVQRWHTLAKRGPCL